MSLAIDGQFILTGMCDPACYDWWCSFTYPIAIEAMGEYATSRINRRALLVRSASAVAVSTVAATAVRAEPPGRAPGPSDTLRALIEAHGTAYAAFGKVLHKIGGGSDSDRASREEERALLAICAYVAVNEGDRLAKAQYLLEIEARGELDLAEHMQAVLRSTMWEG